MAETNQGPIASGWNRGDPPPGYFILRLDCEFCGAKNGFLWPDAGAPPYGMIFEAPKGTSGAGVCRRCGKSNRCRVMSKPKEAVVVPEPWAY